MSGSNGSIVAVVYALVSNTLITIIKFVVAIITNSAGMMAEAIHSVADCGNQIFLLIGNKRSSKNPSELHPFGYGKEEYFWGFLVAVLLFFVGAAFSIYEGVHKLFQPSDIKNIGWSYAVLITSILLEGKSFHVAYTSFTKKHKRVGMYQALKDSTDTNLFVILLEDSAAMLGLTTILITTTFAWFVHPVFDAIGSILVGLLLIAVSLFMINELRKLIVGENIPRDLRDEMKEIVTSNSVIHKVNSISAMMMGKGKYILIIGVDLVDEVTASSIEDQLDIIRKKLRQKSPDIHSIYFDVIDMKKQIN